MQKGKKLRPKKCVRSKCGILREGDIFLNGSSTLSQSCNKNIITFVEIVIFQGSFFFFNPGDPL